MKQFSKQATTLLLAAGMGLAATASWSAESLQDVLKRRNLSQQDLLAAAKTYVPTGKRDEFVAFSSGGQSGQVIVYGVPSMRILKYIGVFTPEPWQGYGFDENSKKVLKQGIDGKDITWGDTHHPAISETNGEYDGQFLFINDKANPRLAVIDLRDFETKQIVVNPIFKSEHGGAFVTSNTEYVIEAAQYAALRWRTRSSSRWKSSTRSTAAASPTGSSTARKAASTPKESFSLELPPYSQDLSDAGKGPSDGWSFTNSFCSERYVGGIEKGRPPYEAGCSAKDTDYLHVINWKKAAELVKPRQGQEDQRPQRAHDGNGDQGRPPLPDPRAEVAARRRRHAGRQVHHRRRQARHPRLGVFLREDPGRDQGQASSSPRIPTAFR
jgi:nitrous-oxide reductase